MMVFLERDGKKKMTVSEVAKYLADYYIYGISIASTLFVILYLIFSIRLVITARRENMDVCVSAFIPLWNIITWVRKSLKHRKNSKIIGEDEEIEL